MAKKAKPMSKGAAMKKWEGSAKDKKEDAKGMKSMMKGRKGGKC